MRAGEHVVASSRRDGSTAVALAVGGSNKVIKITVCRARAWRAWKKVRKHVNFLTLYECNYFHKYKSLAIS
jgi:hypothetical protein